MFKIKFEHILSLHSMNYQNTFSHQSLLSTCICVYLRNSDQNLAIFFQQSFQPVLWVLLHEEYYLALLQVC